MRLRALKDLNIGEIDIYIVEAKDEATKIKYALSDNDRVGQYDEQALTELTYPHIEEINLEDYKLDIGEPISLKDVIEDYAPDIDGEDEVPEIDDSPAITKMGDLFTLGKHRLLCGDATKEGDVKRLMGEEKADMVFTDPPYNLKKDYNTYQDDKSIEEYKKFCELFFSNLNKYSNKNICITCGAQNLSLWLSFSSPKWIYSWIKMNGQSRTPLGGMQKWEPILLFNSERCTEIDVIQANSDRFDGLRESHICPKPVRLIGELMKRFSKSGNVVMDLFLGSGTTVISAEKYKRKCYGLEIDSKYCDVIITRYSNFIDTSEEEIRATRQ